MKRLAALLLTLLLAACSGPSVQQRQFLQFGTLIDISLSGVEGEQAEAAFDAIEELLAERNRQWHAWQDSDLKRFNQALAEQPAEGVPIPDALLHLLQESRRYYALSDGLFNPAMGKLIAAWGFQGDNHTDPERIRHLRQRLPTMDDLRIDGHRAWSDHPDLQLDFGAIAKGLAVAQLGDLLRQRGIDDFIVNAGGDLLVSGRKADGSPWIIGIEDPFAGGALATLPMERGGALFTSGSYRRYVTDEQGKRRQHIIDPRNGEPGEGLRSATVLHPDPVAADVAATVLMLADPQRLPELRQRFGLEEFLVIGEDGAAWISPGWNETLGRQLRGTLRLQVIGK